MNYILAEACQNTFVLFDRLEDTRLEEIFLQHAHRCLQDENRDDALILYDGQEKEGHFYARLLVLGLDGQIAEFCGNGSRACAAYLSTCYPNCKGMYLNTNSGIYPLKKHGGEIYSVKLPVASFVLNTKFVADSLTKGIYVDMLEPHLIVQEELSDEELFQLGRELNQRKDLFPHGINVNAWHEVKKDTLFVKTYERGVQRLTRSCGTGSISCASFYKTLGTVQVETPGGHLEVILHPDACELKGPASFVCTNKIAKGG